MDRTANLTWQEAAEFLFANTDMTKGQIEDALRAANASDEEANLAVSDLTDSFDEPSIDVPDSDQIEEILDKTPSTPSLDAQPTNSGDGKPVVVDVPEGTDEPDMSAEDIIAYLADWQEEHPNASPDDVERALQDLGLSGDKIRALRGFLLGAKVSNFIFSANVSWSTAAQWLHNWNPDMQLEDIKDALRSAGAPDNEIASAVAELPVQETLPDDAFAPDDEMGDHTSPDLGGEPMEQFEENDGESPEVTPEDEATNAPGLDHYFETADSYLEQDPDITPEELMDILTGEGATPEEAQQVVEELGLVDEFAPGDEVEVGGVRAKVLASVDTIYGTVFTLEKEGKLVQAQAQDLKKAKVEKTAATEDSFITRVEAHFADTWYDSMDKLPKAYKHQYESRIAAATELRKEANKRVRAAEDYKTKAYYDDIVTSLGHEINFCNERLGSVFSAEEAAYLINQPKYKMAAETGSEWGPGGGDAIALAAEATQEALNDIDWKNEVTAGAELLVVDIDPYLIGSAGEVRAIASRHIDAKIAHLPDAERKHIRSEFLGNVEKARRAEARTVTAKLKNKKTAQVEMPDGVVDEGMFF